MTARAAAWLLFCLILLAAGGVCARSAFSPRHSGLEPPGGPRSIEAGGRPLMRTPMGGMGYTDAYGNPIEDRAPEEKKTRRRKDAPLETARPRPLPDPAGAAPLWTFQ